MMSDTSLHPSDAQLLSYIDGELSAADAQSVRHHLTTCEACGESTAAFRDTSDDISDLLGSLETVPVPTVPVPKRRAIRAPRLAIVPAPARGFLHPRYVMRAAIVIIGLAAAALTVAPVRAWVVELVRSVAAPQPPSAPLGNEVQQEAPTSTVVSFASNGNVLSIDIAHHQTGGSLRLTTTTDGLVSGRVTGTGVASLLVSGESLRILNDGSPTSSYVVSIPPIVHQVVVRLAGDVILQTTRDALASDIVVSLKANAAEATGEASR